MYKTELFEALVSPDGRTYRHMIDATDSLYIDGVVVFDISSQDHIRLKTCESVETFQNEDQSGKSTGWFADITHEQALGMARALIGLVREAREAAE